MLHLNQKSAGIKSGNPPYTEEILHVHVREKLPLRKKNSVNIWNLRIKFVFLPHYIVTSHRIKTKKIEQ